MSVNFSEGPIALNSTLPQRSASAFSSERRRGRFSLPSVHPINSYYRRPPDGWDQPNSSHVVREKVTNPSRLSPARRKSYSVASSQRSERSLAPSSLRYIGYTPARTFSPVELLGGIHRATPQHRPTSPHSPKTTPRFEVHSVSPLAESETSFPSKLHPLLKQALLLTATGEVEHRLVVLQEQTDAFDDILALFSVAKEVEAVRVAAFEMFDLQADSRRALYAQEKRERRILKYWYVESYNNAVLSHEVRTLQLEGSQAPVRHADSLLRARSRSLEAKTRDFFVDKPAATRSLPRARVAQPEVAPAAASASAAPSSSRQLSYPTQRGSSQSLHRRNRFPQRSVNYTAESSSSSSSYSYSSSSSRISESLDAAEKADPAPRRVSQVATEKALDDRIARQQLLLASGRPNDRRNVTPLFPTRTAPNKSHF